MHQPALFEMSPDFRFKGAGHRRTHVGNVVEEIVCAALGWTRNARGNQGTFTADAFNADGLPCEIKSVCCSGKMEGKSVLYDFRLKKDAAHAPRLTYAFFCYPSKGKGKARTMSVWLDRLATAPSALVLVPAWDVRAWAANCTLCKPPASKGGRKRDGATREGYRDGYRNVPVGQFIRTAALEPRTVELWGRTFHIEAGATHPDPWSIDPRTP